MGTGREFIPIGFGILTVSDTRNLSSDKSGALLQENVLEAGHRLVQRKIVQDEKIEIQKVLKIWIEDQTIDVILTTGGTLPNWQIKRWFATVNFSFPNADMNHIEIL